tara:strand:- start:799 stop:1329 length:531 start_codon:yes stop_codon:yes gene_type:complete
MFLLKSNDQYLIESISHLLKQKNFFHTLDEKQKYFFTLNINTIKKEMEICSLHEKKKIILPTTISNIITTINNLFIDYEIEVNDAKFYPLRQSLEFKNKTTNLGNIHFIIFSHLLLNCNEGSNKVELYKSIWPLDKEYQVNKLDTHLTNLKNYLKEKLNFNLIFTTNLGSIYFRVN